MLEWMDWMENGLDLFPEYSISDDDVDLDSMGEKERADYTALKNVKAADRKSL